MPRKKGRKLECEAFPSLAPVVTQASLSDEVLWSRSTVIVKADGIAFEVGEQAHLAISQSTAPVLHTNYVSSSEYLALALGALSYMGVTDIDHLILGLPVKLFASKKETLQTRMTGEHELARGKKCTVHNVKVMAQPLGGFVDYALSTGKFDTLKHQRNLLVDPGFGTTDWMVADGLHDIPNRSGSCRIAMSNFVKAIGEGISEKLNLDFTESGDLLRIDHALRNNPEFRANGDLVNVNDYTAKASQIFDGAITELQNSIGTMKDIDNIILVGGGATYLQPILQKSFPKHPIILVEDPLFSIVRGLHLAGEQFATAQQRKTA